VSVPFLSPRLLVRAHAKINLSLEVVGVRDDGYHLLRTVFQSLALHDLLSFDACDGRFELTCTDPEVPTGRRNLVCKAAALLWACAGRAGEPAGVRVHLAKRIPAQGGLGGGSADAAAALVALDVLWQAQVDEGQMEELARRLGADVPFFLCGGTALGLERGDRISPMDDLPPRPVVLVFPPFGVSTPEAFRWFDDGAVGGRASTAGAPQGQVLSAGDGRSVAVFNELQAPVSRRHPEIDEICGALRARGADAASMTGSGSTVFGLFSSRAAAADAAAALGASGWRTLVTETAGRREAEIRVETG
jgi:4-diphosphocytidyl-2-C-methyl-D-erythritol kinase